MKGLSLIYANSCFLASCILKVLYEKEASVTSILLLQLESSKNHDRVSAAPSKRKIFWHIFIELGNRYFI